MLIIKDVFPMRTTRKSFSFPCIKIHNLCYLLIRVKYYTRINRKHMKKSNRLKKKKNWSTRNGAFLSTEILVLDKCMLSSLLTEVSVTQLFAVADLEGVQDPPPPPKIWSTIF